MALVAALLFLPRPATSLVLPLPAIVWEEAVSTRKVDETRRAEAQKSALAFDVRAVGEAIRQYGFAEDRALATSVDYEHVRRAALRAREKLGAEPMLQLRAVQLRIFLDAFTEFQETGTPPEDLRELGGNFLGRAQRDGWLQGPYPITVEELETLFRIRWTELTGLGDDSAFRTTLNEWRIHYGFFLRTLGPSARLKVGLGYIQALARRDSTYPEMLATGVLYHQHQAYPLAVKAFGRHLESQPYGPWALRATNYLAAALDAAGAAEE